MSKQSPAMNPPLIQHLEYNGMEEYGDQVILGTSQQITKLESDTNNFLQKLASITVSLPNRSKTISFEKYITKVNRLR